MDIELVGIKGEFEIKLYGPDGLLKDYRKIKNLVVNSGFNTVCHQIGNPNFRPSAFQYCAVGTGTDAPSAGDSLLVAEVTRVAGLFTHVENTSEWYNDATFGAGTGTGLLTEAGIFNNSTVNAATMLSRQTFSVISKGVLDVLTLRWTYVLS